jgi:hypothetical protein
LRDIRRLTDRVARQGRALRGSGYATERIDETAALDVARSDDGLPPGDVLKLETAPGRPWPTERTSGQAGAVEGLLEAPGLAGL